MKENKKSECHKLSENLSIVPSEYSSVNQSVKSLNDIIA